MTTSRKAAAPKVNRGGQETGAGQRGKSTSDYTAKAPTKSTGFLDQALAYAARGWWVFPLKPNTKIPITKHGFKDASNDPKVIRAWWTKTPRANIGLDCGRSGVLVIDVDGDEGLETLADLEAARGLVYHTLTSHTPGKAGKGAGLHLIFDMPAGTPIGNKKIGPGLETRGAGGYIVLAPSIHPDHLKGPAYRWEDEHAPIADLPQVFIDLLTAQPENTPRSAAAAPSPARSVSQAEIEHYTRAAFDDELTNLRAAREGDRNNQLNRSAYSLGQLIGAGTLDRITVEAALEQVARDIGLKGKEVTATIKSGLDDGLTKPRDLSHLADRRNGHHAAQPANDANPQFLDRLPLTDAGNAEAFTMLFGDDLRYDFRQKRWLSWDAHRWAPDSDGHIDRLSLRAIRARQHAALNIEDQDRRLKAIKWAVGSENQGRLSATNSLARSMKPIADKGDKWDQDAWLMGCDNGVIDLRTGNLRAARRDDAITLSTGITYDPEAHPRRFIRFLSEVFDRNDDLIAFIQRIVGYSLTADTREHCMMLCHGSGRNGKSVLLNTLRLIMGDYAMNTPFSTFENLRDSGGNTPTNDIALLSRARLVTASETNEARRLNEARVKAIAGGDPITARFLYGEYFTYQPGFKVWLAMNHKPIVTGTDDGIWTRIRLIPFNVSFKGREDKTLQETLKAERAGILSWAVQGCLQWQAYGLKEPEIVLKATEDYRQESDLIGQFLNECTIRAEDKIARAGQMYEAYEKWCNENGCEAKSGNVFGRYILELPEIDKVRDTAGNYYTGIGLIA
jgi:putative DNA primase/helicase